jgi:hypothetical protein
LDLPDSAGPKLALTVPPEEAALPLSTLAEPALERLRSSNPAARVLPLLAALARGETARITIEHDRDQTLQIEHVPCR